ncbi:MAG: GNAT family N-acetyltransferase [Nitrospirae bacterium]|nr:MAG: GNAT family N-acetyltransferase [Nitrospirota bacterium]
MPYRPGPTSGASALIKELSWDSEFFSRKIGKLFRVPKDGAAIDRLLRHAAEDGYSYLTCRTALAGTAKLRLLQSRGFYVTDIGATWERLTEKQPRAAFQVRDGSADDASSVWSMARGLFRTGRFYNDPFFTKKEAGLLYQTWVRNSLGDRGLKTFIVDKGGFITCRQVSKSKGEIQLIGVTPLAQGKGVGRSLVYHSMSWFRKNGVEAVDVRTQVNNLQAMNFYSKAGFRIVSTDVTMGMILGRQRRRAEIRD